MQTECTIEHVTSAPALLSMLKISVYSDGRMRGVVCHGDDGDNC